MLKSYQTTLKIKSVEKELNKAQKMLTANLKRNMKSTDSSKMSVDKPKEVEEEEVAKQSPLEALQTKKRKNKTEAPSLTAIQESDEDLPVAKKLSPVIESELNSEASPFEWLIEISSTEAPMAESSSPSSDSPRSGGSASSSSQPTTAIQPAVSASIASITTLTTKPSASTTPTHTKKTSSPQPMLMASAKLSSSTPANPPAPIAQSPGLFASTLTAQPTQLDQLPSHTHLGKMGAFIKAMKSIAALISEVDCLSKLLALTADFFYLFEHCSPSDNLKRMLNSRLIADFGSRLDKDILEINPTLPHLRHRRQLALKHYSILLSTTCIDNLPTSAVSIEEARKKFLLIFDNEFVIFAKMDAILIEEMTDMLLNFVVSKIEKIKIAGGWSLMLIKVLQTEYEKELSLAVEAVASHEPSRQSL